MNRNLNSFFKTLLLLAGGAVIVGALMVIGYLNVPRQIAEADQIKSDTAQKNAIFKMDFPYLEDERKAERDANLARTQAKRDADIAQINEAGRMQVERNNLQLVAETIWIVVEMILAVLFGLVVCIALGRALYRIASYVPVATKGHTTSTAAKEQVTPIAVKEQKPPIDSKAQDETPLPWHDQDFRKLMRELAHEKEHEFRRASQDHRSSLSEGVVRSNGHNRNGGPN